jgi:hypothetical protein
MMLDECVLSYRGTVDQSKWIYTKATCDGATVVRQGYKDDQCSVAAADDTGFDDSWPVACTDGRTITCDNVHDVAVANAYMLPPDMASSQYCTPGTHASDHYFAIGACHVRFDGNEYKGFKAECGDGEVVMNYFNGLDCTGQKMEKFRTGSTCAPAFNANGFMAIQSGCGSPSLEDTSKGSDDTDTSKGSDDTDTSAAAGIKFSATLPILAIGPCYFATF